MTRSDTPNSTRRPAFTLVEVLVAAGLCMFIMALLSYAFTAGIDTLSKLKSIGELAEQDAMLGQILTNDLKYIGLENDRGEPLKVSDLRYDALWVPGLEGDPTVRPFIQPPRAGFFRATQLLPSQPDVVDALNNPVSDSDSIASTQSAHHSLQFTVKLAANRSDRVFTTKMPQNAAMTGLTANEAATVNQVLGFNQNSLNPPSSVATGSQAATTFASRWAEVAYFLSSTPTSFTPQGSNGNPLPLYSLHRRVRLLLPKEASINPVTGATVAPIKWKDGANSVDFNHARITNPALGTTGSPNMSVRPDTTVATDRLLNTIYDVTNPNNRMGFALALQNPPGTANSIDTLAPIASDVAPFVPTGEDIVLTNVLSFELKFWWEGGRHYITNDFAATPAIPQVPEFGPTPVQLTGGRNPLLVRQPGTVTTVTNVTVPQLERVPPYGHPTNGDARTAALSPSAAPLLGTPVGYPAVPAYPVLPAGRPTYSFLNRPDDPHFDDLPLAPSLRIGYQVTGGMTTYDFPTGSGNPLFARWMPDANAPPPSLTSDVLDTSGATTKPKPRVFDTWTQAFGEEWRYAVQRPVPPLPVPMGGYPTTSLQASSSYIPLPVRMRAVQIKVRIFDPKNKLTRQVTIVQDL